MIHLLLATSLSLQALDTSRIRAQLAAAAPSVRYEVADAAVRAVGDSVRVLPFGDDKVRHFFTTYAAYSFSYAGDRAIGMSRKAALIDAGVAAFAVGVGKEVYDQMHHKRFSGFDLVADALGGVLAFVAMKQVR